MKEGPDIAYIAALIGDPARANILTALLSGKALTATELAAEAGVTLQTASSHLSKLVAGDLLRVLKQGRHKYFSLTNDDVAHVLESIMGLAAGAGHLRIRTGPKDMALRHARVCYSHLAGHMGIRLYDSLIASGYIYLDDEELKLTDDGIKLAQGFGIDIDELRTKPAPLCRQCLDWSERRSHLAGSLGRAFLSRFEALGWAKRDQKTRIVKFSTDGKAEFERIFGA